MFLPKYLRTLLSFVIVAVLTTTVLSQSAPSTLHFQRTTFNTGPEPNGVVSGDFNEDGRTDLAITDNLWNVVQILLNGDNGHFNQNPTTPALRRTPKPTWWGGLTGGGGSNFAGGPERNQIGDP